jgi:hypothetical protein
LLFAGLLCLFLGFCLSLSLLSPLDLCWAKNNRSTLFYIL